MFLKDWICTSYFLVLIAKISLDNIYAARKMYIQKCILIFKENCCFLYIKVIFLIFNRFNIGVKRNALTNLQENSSQLSLQMFLR